MGGRSSRGVGAALAAAAGVAAALLAASAPTPAATAPAGVAEGAPGQPLFVSVFLGKDGCDLSATRLASGPATFTTTNSDDVGVNEVQLRRGTLVLAEDEDLPVGGTDTLSVTLDPGDYTLTCPRAHFASLDVVPLTVVDVPRPALTGAALAKADALAAAVTGYRTYLTQQTAELIADTKPFEEAVLAGDVVRARALYPVARVAYERIEPVAEAFPDLDASIDARLDDVSDPAAWTGFHFLEHELWADGSLAGTQEYAKLLLFDVNALSQQVTTIPLQPSTLANGAKTLLDEVARTKVTGEEERYSHVDLLDFQANVDGAQEAFSLLRPALPADAAALIAQRFADVDRDLAAYRTGPGPADFVTFDRVDPAGRKRLATDVDALSAPLAEVSGLIVSAP